MPFGTQGGAVVRKAKDAARQASPKRKRRQAAALQSKVKRAGKSDFRTPVDSRNRRCLRYSRGPVIRKERCGDMRQESTIEARCYVGAG